LVLNGDAVSDINFSLLSLQKPNTIVCTYLNDARDFGLVTIQGGRITNFLEKPEKKKAGFINCGAYVLSSSVFNEIADEKFMIENTVFPRLAKAGALRAYIHKGYWIDVGTEARFRQAHIDLAKKKSTI
ncbi:MAG: hypothetical protein HYZ69_03315, partial [Candidatus Colwellbacteria bacterium]|nr:hypothetical protein [Candidatus Colwellbacteria bacterium]